MFGPKTNVPKKFIQEFEEWRTALSKRLDSLEGEAIIEQVTNLWESAGEVAGCLRDEKLNRPYILAEFYELRDGLSLLMRELRLAQ